MQVYHDQLFAVIYTRSYNPLLATFEAEIAMSNSLSYMDKETTVCGRLWIIRGANSSNSTGQQNLNFFFVPRGKMSNS
jgi:hypothetical protein